MFLRWRADPVTQELLAGLQAEINRAKESWASGEYLRDDPAASLRVQIEVLARINTLNGLVTMTYEDFKELFAS